MCNEAENFHKMGLGVRSKGSELRRNESDFRNKVFEVHSLGLHNRNKDSDVHNKGSGIQSKALVAHRELDDYRSQMCSATAEGLLVAEQWNFSPGADYTTNLQSHAASLLEDF